MSAVNSGTITCTQINSTGTTISGSGTFGTIFSNPVFGTNYNPSYSPNVIVYFAADGRELVRLTATGKVEWAKDIDVDSAAEAFARTLILGSEVAVGIKTAAKLRIRDSIFEDIINIAKVRGPLSVDDLTFMLESSKIVEKLKG
jgi:hypothetical protein